MLLWSGGDWGSEVSKALGTLHSDNCRAIHVNFVRSSMCALDADGYSMLI